MAETQNKGRNKDIIYVFREEFMCGNCCEADGFPRMTRQDAIERMANALALVQAKTFVDEIQWERVMNGCRYEAEAALNALLEK